MAGVFDHPWLSGLFADAEMAAIWSASTQLSHMLAFEAAWSRAGAAAGLWSKAAGAAAAAAIETADIPPGELAEGTSRDGMCAPELVRRLKAIAGEEAVHRGATSQDVVDTATALSITASLDLLSARLDKLDAALDRLDRDFGDAPLLGRTRMQAALEIKVRDRLKSWRGPIADHKARLRDLRPRVARV
ncbi:MAG: lyase family protein, partial [Pseudomonadota bacterium]